MDPQSDCAEADALRDLHDMSLEDSDEEIPELTLDYHHPAMTMRVFPNDFPPLYTPGGFLYKYQRSLRGIEYRWGFPTRPELQLPSCGHPLDNYMQVMGYDGRAWHRIHEVLTTANSISDFIRELQEEGVPVIECKFMWSLFNEHPPSEGQMALIHIM